MTEYDGADVVLAAASDKWDTNLITRPTGNFWGKLTSTKKINIALGDYVLAYEVDETDEPADLFYETEHVNCRVTVDIRSRNESRALLLDAAVKKALSYVRCDASGYGAGKYLYVHIGQRMNHSNRAIGLFHYTRDFKLIKPHRTMDDEP